MSVTISPAAYEAAITEKDVILRKEERQTLNDEIRLLEHAIRERKDRRAHITAELCLIELSASHQLQCKGIRYGTA